MHIQKGMPMRPEPLDIREVGTPIDGEPQTSDRRLFCQLHVFSGCRKPKTLAELLEITDINAVLYEELNHPSGIGILFMEEDLTKLITEVRSTFTSIPFAKLTYRPEMTMIGRTYATGREPDLEQWLINKPLQNALNPDCPWAIWYPLRRKPEFYRLEPRERGRVLGEHATLGRNYAAAGYASDIRLACFGLDTNDNEFVIGLVGAELYPLSRLIQDMRQTEQTTKYIESLGPFFVGKALLRFPR